MLMFFKIEFMLCYDVANTKFVFSARPQTIETDTVPTVVMTKVPQPFVIYFLVQLKLLQIASVFR